MSDDRLSIALTHADGRITRLGPDETDAANIPQDLTFSTSIPGGFKDASLGLLRRIDSDWPDLNLFDNVRIIGPGGRVAWEGRSQQFPRSHGDSFSITPGAVGWSSHLRDNPTYRQIYIDRDLGRWQGMSLKRKIGLAASSFPIVDKWAVEPDPTDGASAITTGLTGPWAANSITEPMYDAGSGMLIGRIRGQCTIVSGVAFGDANWTVQTELRPDETSGGDSFNNRTAGSGATFDLAATGSRRFAHLQMRYGAAVATAGEWLLRWNDLRVFGDHGLTIRGTTAADEGLYASDVIADVVANAAPLLTYTTGAGGSIEATTFVIPHLVYRDPVTAEFVISDVNKYHLYDWGVWENREFFYRQPDPDRLCWEARLGDGAYMDADGMTGEQVINGVAVTYTDATGVQKTVGPPGGSFDSTSADLQDTSTGNPVNSHGIPAKWDNLTLSFPTTEAGAIQIGTVYLAERSLATRRGSLRLTGSVQHPTEGKVPVWRVRAGDWVRVTDLNGENATVQRKIISTSYSHSSRQITLELDNTPSKLSAILERVGVMTGIRAGSGF